MSSFPGIGGLGNTFPPGGVNVVRPPQPNPTVSVTVGNIRPDNRDGTITDLGKPDETFEDYEIHSRYEKDLHVYMGGITSPTPFQGISAGFYQLAAPTLLWVVDWTASKWNGVPEIPDPNIALGGTAWVLLDIHLEPVSIINDGSNRKPMYRISGTYYYGHANPAANVFANVEFPRLPMWNDLWGRTVPLSKLTQNLTNVTGTNNIIGRVPQDLMRTK